MKKNLSIILLLIIVMGALGCQQKKEQKNQMTYGDNQVATLPPQMPSQLQIDQLQMAVKTSPKSVEAWTNLGNALMDAQRFGEAVDAYEKSLALEPKNVNVIVDLGTCYRGVGKFDKAVEQYRKALKIDPNFPNAHRNLGVVLSYDLHNKKEGLKAFQRYLEIVPNAPDSETIKQTIRELSSAK
jgi:cytochrome c-type biogenesis protein CcmH/NrfG